MKGLRVYLDLKRADTQGESLIFYSQRGGGPYYRWRYEELRGKWLSSRMQAGFNADGTCLAAWKEIPATLKTTLDLHYVE